MRHFRTQPGSLPSQWRKAVTSQQPWTPKPELGQLSSAERPFWVSDGQTVGVAKPGKKAQKPVAAQEKIASDLAYDLGLPVPPVILWDRGSIPDGECRHVCISAMPFGQPTPWGQIKKDDGLLSQLRPLMEEVMSAMVAFDTWLDNHDHKDHAGNLLIQWDQSTTQPRIAYIDYGHAMLHTWSTKGFDNNTCAPIYDRQSTVNIQALKKAATTIQDMSDDHVNAVVARVPSDYLPDDQRCLLAEGLIDRKKRLANILATQHGGLIQ